jgi:hypothetical protein
MPHATCQIQGSTVPRGHGAPEPVTRDVTWNGFSFTRFIGSDRKNLLRITPETSPAVGISAAKMTDPAFRPALLVVDMQEDFCPPVSLQPIHDFGLASILP